MLKAVEGPNNATPKWALLLVTVSSAVFIFAAVSPAIPFVNTILTLSAIGAAVGATKSIVGNSPNAWRSALRLQGADHDGSADNIQKNLLGHINTHGHLPKGSEKFVSVAPNVAISDSKASPESENISSLKL